MSAASRKFHCASLHPEFLQHYFNLGVCKAAAEKQIVSFNCIQIRDFAVDKHGSVDARPYGGGDSMVLRPEPLAAIVNRLSVGRKPLVIATSPGAPAWTHADAERMAAFKGDILFVCGRFAGIDERFVQKYVDESFSVGEFVVSGGELPVLIMIDAIVRQIPGVLGNAESAKFDSFASGLDGFIEYPLYTRPENFEGAAVPEVLLSGDHKEIERWRKQRLRIIDARLTPRP